MPIYFFKSLLTQCGYLYFNLVMVCEKRKTWRPCRFIEKGFSWLIDSWLDQVHCCYLMELTNIWRSIMHKTFTSRSLRVKEWMNIYHTYILVLFWVYASQFNQKIQYTVTRNAADEDWTLEREAICVTNIEYLFSVTLRKKSNVFSFETITQMIQSKVKEYPLELELSVLMSYSSIELSPFDGSLGASWESSSIPADVTTDACIEVKKLPTASPIT